ncbi:MAG: hypothetical protein JO329_18560, partial [Planctomycetaceae bacterium]|nr:hypothetical protein [Planctomycetaceae bacterium]
MAKLSRSSSAWRGRVTAWALFVFASLTCLTLVPLPRLRAQDAKAESSAAPVAESRAGVEAAPPKPKSMLRWALEASGPIG